MNRLSFRDFHQRHFGPEQKLYWQTYLQQQQQQQQQESQHQYGYADADYYNETAYHAYSSETIEDEDQLPVEEPLSKETLEVIAFSENYRREREEEQRRLEEEERRGEEDWPYDESSVLNSGLSEPPATCLVLVNSKCREGTMKQLRQKEDLLNARYMAACQPLRGSTDGEQDAPIVLWPSLPFKV